MNCQNNIQFISKRKVFISCLLLILIVLLFVPFTYWVSPPMPNSREIEIKRNLTTQICEGRLCIYKWIKRQQSNITQLHKTCPNYIWHPFINKTLQLYQEMKVDYQFLLKTYHFNWYRVCHGNCGITGLFQYFYSFHAQYMRFAWMEHHELCVAGYHTKDTCRWTSYSHIFRVYFSFFSIPVTLILTFINLTTLLKLLGKGAGAALYLHTAEIITDSLLNIIVNFQRGLLLFLTFDLWRQSCTSDFQYISLFQSFAAIQYLVSFLNQAYLMGILGDRLYALTKPFQYNAMTDSYRKKQAKSIILKILLVTFTLYFPCLILYTFSPVVSYWKTVSNSWKIYIDYVNFVFLTFYISIGFFALISQIVCGVIVEKKFRKYIKQQIQMKQENESELKKKERDKQLLLVGTIGLNVIIGIITALFNVISNEIMMNLLGYSKQSGFPWWSRLFFMADPVLIFINGNGGLLIHILFVKSYRDAFRATWFGRLIFSNQVHPA